MGQSARNHFSHRYRRYPGGEQGVARQDRGEGLHRDDAECVLSHRAAADVHFHADDGRRAHDEAISPNLPTPMTPERVERDAAAYVDFLVSHESVRPRKVGGSRLLLYRRVRDAHRGGTVETKLLPQLHSMAAVYIPIRRQVHITYCHASRLVSTSVTPSTTRACR